MDYLLCFAVVLSAVQNKSLSDQVFEQLATEIVSGRYEIGQVLPAERLLAETFQVNRHVVREALKRLEQAGLLKTVQGGGSKVLDFKRTAGLDLLLLLGKYASGTGREAVLWISVLEMRAAVAADLVRLCALRADDKTRQGLVETVSLMEAAGSDQELLMLDLKFWEGVLEGAGNIAYRLIFNSMLSGISGVPELTLRLSMHELRESKFRKQLAAAICNGDPAGAEVQVREVMQSSLEAASEFLKNIDLKNERSGDLVVGQN